MILPSVDPVTLLRLARHNDEELALFFDFCSHSRRRGGRSLRVPAADGRTMQEFPLSGGYLFERG
jgi:hypothetical protein